MTVMLLHDLGDPRAGADRRAAAPSHWLIPDLPGHGATPAPRSGHYDPMAPIALARWALQTDPDATLIGVREHAHGALVYAAGGGCARVVLVDGLGGVWQTPTEQIDTFYASLRAMFNDPLATEPAPAHGVDPRSRYSYGVMTSRSFAQRFWVAIEQPVLVIETPVSTTPAAERPERLTWFGGEATLAVLDSDSPAAIVDAVQTWLTLAP